MQRAIGAKIIHNAWVVSVYWREGELTLGDPVGDLRAVVRDFEGDISPVDGAEKVAVALNCSQVLFENTVTGLRGLVVQPKS